MKVRVRIIKSPYTNAPTESLQAILYNHAHDKLLTRLGTKQLFAIMGELDKRNAASGHLQKTADEALADRKRHYMPQPAPKLRVDYAGGFDHCLLELSDVLPASVYAVDINIP